MYFCVSILNSNLFYLCLAPSAKKQMGRPKKPVDPADHRHRKTEKEEDEELLEQETKNTNVFLFDKNPWYIKVIVFCIHLIALFRMVNFATIKFVVLTGLFNSNTTTFLEFWPTKWLVYSKFF